MRSSSPAVRSQSSASEEDYKYWAFISYSHADAKWAEWLHKQLETFPVPRAVVGRETQRGYVVPKRLFPVFRDREELPGSADLAQNISEALRCSRYLVVVCSPRSAVSRWVNQEVMAFKAMGRADRLLCMVVDGEPNATDKPEAGMLECFPPGVRYEVGLDGQLTERREEPIAADARAGKDGRRDALIKVAAGLLGVGFDELKQREARRQRRQKTLYALASAAFVALLAWGAWEFRAQRQQLQNAASSMADFREAAATFDSGDSGLGMAYLARALKKDPANQAAAQRLFYELTYKNWAQSISNISAGTGYVASAETSPDFTKLALVTSGSSFKRVLVIDTVSGKQLLDFEGNQDWEPRFVSFCGDSRLAVRAMSPMKDGIPNVVTLIDLKNGKRLEDLRVENHAANCVTSTEDGGQVFIGWGRTEPVSYWDKDRYVQSGPDGKRSTKANEAETSNTLEPKSGVIQAWKYGVGKPLGRTTQGPITCLRLDEARGTIHAASQGKTQGYDTAQIETLWMRDLGSADDVIQIDAPVYDVQVSTGDKRIVLSCGDSSTRIYGQGLFSKKPTLRHRIRGQETQKILRMETMLGITSNSGHARVDSLEGDALLPGWELGARFGAMDANEPLNFTLVSWAGITPIDRGGRVLVKSLMDPTDDLARAPLEPPLWWPSRSIFLAAIAPRSDKLLIVAHGPTTEGFAWEVLRVDTGSRAARRENVNAQDIKAGSVSKSGSGRYFAYIAKGNNKDTNRSIVLYDAMERSERCRIRARPDVSGVVFAAGDARIVAIAESAVTVYDANLRAMGEFAVEGALAHEGNGGLPFWVTPDVVTGDEASPLLAVVESTKNPDKYFLRIFRLDRARQMFRTPLAGRPTAIALRADGESFVAAWEEGDVRKCALINSRDGLVHRNFPDHSSPRAFSYDGRRLLMSAFPNDLLYETKSWSQVNELAGHSRMVSAHAFDPQNRFVVTGAIDGTVRFWNLEDGMQLGEVIPPLSQRKSRASCFVSGLHLDKTGNRLLVSRTELDNRQRGSVSVWDTTEHLATFPETRAQFLADAWLVEDGSALALVTGEGGGWNVSHLDASLATQKMPSSAWALAQEVSGYDVANQIVKSERFPDVTVVCERILGAASKSTGSFDQWLRWLMSAPKDRTISPFSKVQASEYRRVLMEELRMQRHLIEAFEMDPSDDLNLANLALVTDSQSSSEGMWNEVLRSAPNNKDVLFRRAVRLFENSLDESAIAARKASTQLLQLVRSSLETDLSWRPRETGLARNPAFFINRAGFLRLISHSGTPDAAKRASLMSVKEQGIPEDVDSRKKFVNETYANIIFFWKTAPERSGAAIFCGAELRRSFWLNQALNPLGDELAFAWASLAPATFVAAVANDRERLYGSYPTFALPFWKFAYESLRRAAKEAPAMQSTETTALCGTLASTVALHLVRSGQQGADAEFFAREGLSCREAAGVTGWPLANSKALLGAALLQQDKLSSAESFVVEGAKALLSLKDTLPEGARPRVTEAVRNAVLLFEKSGNQTQRSYWRSELEKLDSDPRFTVAE